MNTNNQTNKLTTNEYYEILKQKWEQVDKNSLEQIHAYNEFKRQLRKGLEAE